MRSGLLPMLRFYPQPMRAHRPRNPAETLLADRDSDAHIATLTQRLIAATDADQASELATLLVTAIREHIDRLRRSSVKEPLNMSGPESSQG